MAKKKEYRLSQRFKKILKAFSKFEGTATMQKIAKETKLTVSGVSQSLKALQKRNYVKRLKGERGSSQWNIIKSE